MIPPVALYLRIAAEATIVRIGPDTLMTSNQIRRVDLILDLKKPVVVLLAPEAVDVVWLVCIRFVLISAAVRRDSAQWIHQSASMPVMLGIELRRMRFRAIDIPR